MVYEDTDNPCVNELKKKYENRITSQSSSLLEDLKTLLKAEVLISTWTSLVSNAVYYLSKNIKKIYFPYYITEKDKDNSTEKWA